jgi:hypothetical protein
MATITLTFAGNGNPALINSDWIAYGHEEEGPHGKHAMLELGSPQHGNPARERELGPNSRNHEGDTSQTPAMKPKP